MSRAWVLVLATGCDSVFGLDLRPVDAPVPPMIDAPPDAIAVGSCTSSGQRIELPLLADTYLDITAKHGTDPVLKLSNSPQTVLLRLALGDLAQTIGSVEIALALVTIAGACGPGGTCSFCAIQAGMVSTYWMRSDWDEAVVDREVRKTGTPWEIVGASGSTDRSGLISVINQAGDVTATMPFDPARLQGEWPQAELGIQLVGTPGTSAGTYASKETGDNTCDPSRAPPRVTAICR